MSIFHRNIAFFKRKPGFFIPSSLKAALAHYDVTHPTTAQLSAVFEALIQHQQSTTHRIYTSSTLLHFYHGIQYRIDDIYRLHNDELVNHTLTSTTIQTNDHTLSGWCILMDAGLYNPTNRERVQQHARSLIMIKGLYALLQTQLLNQNSLDFLLDHDHPNDFILALLVLKQQQLLNNANLMSLKQQNAPACGDVLHLIWRINSTLISTNLSCIFMLSPRSISVLKTALTEFLHYTVATFLNEELFNTFLIIADDGYYLSKQSLFETLSSCQCLPLTSQAMSALLLDKHQDNMPSIINIISFLKQHYSALKMYAFVDAILIKKSASEMAPLVTRYHHTRRWNETLLIACAQHVSLRQLVMLILQTTPQCINDQTINAMQLFDAARALLVVWHPQFTSARVLTFCHHPHRWLISQNLQRLNMHHTPQYMTLLDYFLTCKEASVIQDLEALISLFSKTELFETHVFDAIIHRFTTSSHADIISTKLVTLFTLIAKNAPHLLLKPHFDDIMQHQALDVLTDILQLIDGHHLSTLDSPSFFTLCAYSEPRLIKLSLLHIKTLPDHTTHSNEIALLLHSIKLTCHGISTKSIPLSQRTNSLSSNRYIYWQPSPEQDSTSKTTHEQNHKHLCISFADI